MRDLNVCIIAFSSTSQSVNLYKILKNKKYNVVMIQTPCTISAGCARSIEIKEQDLEDIVNEIKQNNLEIKGIYRRVLNESTRRYYYSELDI
ncbi:DUF3343 domain-containing protein [Clostridium folliculivorans]|uniref:Putative Se/S carrier protein-like domain-containing protein n=1 Tax=Clostridium folliculivorans TaxID=2886038 RepID=A0A9W6D9B3_9CLOT|nr:DUF3343 domain-containing protein [Clostridium folliculivorans]GKU23523.1 hypothetical protein CFOLD11_03490 [Clostridium folliculivorans]GKU29639.1 hypothetical protein CFB3_17460 [Clostridium folliculivorans]